MIWNTQEYPCQLVHSKSFQLNFVNTFANKLFETLLGAVSAMKTLEESSDAQDPEMSGNSESGHKEP